MSGTAQAPPAVDPAKLVFWVDIGLLGALGLVALAVFHQRLRRCLAGVGGWKRGHLLYYTETNALSQRPVVFPKRHSRLRRFLDRSRLSSTFTHNALYFLRTPVIPRYSVGQSIIMLLYFGLLLFASVFRDSVFTNPVRDAWIAVSQLPFVFALAAKNNVFTVLTGAGYEKLNYLHRYAGRLVVLAANVHALGFIYKWTLSGVWTARLQEAEFRWGLVALVSFDILAIFSLRTVRQLSYNLFYFTHLVGGVVLIIAISFHQPASRPYTIIAAGLYAGDRLIRLLKSRICTAHVQCIPDLGTTLIRIPRLNAGWRAGQHVRIRVLSAKMGWLGWAELHPYTIAGASATLWNSGEGGGEEGLTLMIKQAGDWSRKLYSVAEHGEYDSWPEKGTRLRVHIDGPYGGPGNTEFSAFSGALFVVGGSGITYALAAISEILRDAQQNGATYDHVAGMSTIELIWIVQNARSVTPLLPVFTSLLQSSGSATEDLTTYRPSATAAPASASRFTKPTLKISVYYTRAVTYLDACALPMDDQECSPRKGSRTTPFTYAGPTDQRVATKRERHRESVREDHTPTFPLGLTVHPSRPWIPYALANFADETSNALPDREAKVEEGSGCKVMGRGIVVGVCGPPALADDVRRAVGCMDEGKRRAVGGVDFVEEAFHW
ncbi:ferric reductase like transmembrane component-domain-containing protein [Cristinia sonorae]|uniref:ferric-chelate reductase (NADPH) n=1 Tax=Cristinia sonorae TaxID=1940300 RepID=A0A8K0XLV1_9AGAR|nr:ferric reductase like transmembrane component-domain-containing protein [Cristinia sonorae]